MDLQVPVCTRPLNSNTSYSSFLITVFKLLADKQILCSKASLSRDNVSKKLLKQVCHETREIKWTQITTTHMTMFGFSHLYLQIPPAQGWPLGGMAAGARHLEPRLKGP